MLRVEINSILAACRSLLSEAVCAVFGQHLPAMESSLQAACATDAHICDFLALPRPLQNPPDVQVILSLPSFGELSGAHVSLCLSCHLVINI